MSVVHDQIGPLPTKDAADCEVPINGESKSNHDEDPLRVQPSAPPPEPESGSSTEDDPMEVFKDGSIDVFVRAYEKRGEGISAYLVYKIETRVRNIPGYNKAFSEVWRRFSDFLGLRDKLLDTYQCKGVVVPMAPEKSVKALTKTKLNTTNDETYTNEVAEKRARHLERFLRRLIRSPRLVTNHELIDFLTLDANLPKATGTAAFSSNNMKKMLKSFGDAINKIAFPVDENDRWFEHVHGRVEELEENLIRLNINLDALVNHRRDLAQSSEQLSKTLSMIASCEENTALARSITKLAETHESLSVVQKHEADMDSQLLADVLLEHVQLTQVLKELFFERVRLWQNWQSHQQQLAKKREAKARYDLAGKSEQARHAKADLDHHVQRVDALEKDFLAMSKMIRQEYERISAERRKDIKNAFIERLESLAESEQQVLDHWEKFAPEIKNIL